jgi:hypothetical protein
MNSVVIDPPYEVNNCYSKRGDSRALEHVRKIVRKTSSFIYFMNIISNFQHKKVKKFHEDYKLDLQTHDKATLENSANVSCNSFTSPSSPPPSSSSSVSSTTNEK